MGARRPPLRVHRLPPPAPRPLAEGLGARLARPLACPTWRAPSSPRRPARPRLPRSPAGSFAWLGRSSGPRTSWCSPRRAPPACSTTATYLVDTIVAFVCFCLAASGTYYLNDARDVDADRRHPTKRNRPVAAGVVPVGVAYGRRASSCWPPRSVWRPRSALPLVATVGRLRRPDDRLLVVAQARRRRRPGDRGRRVRPAGHRRRRRHRRARSPTGSSS